MTDRIYGVNTTHRSIINKSDNGSSMDPEPCKVTAICSCGWKSYTFVEAWHNTAKPEMIFIEPYKSFVKKWGIEETLGSKMVFGPHSMLETYALKALLVHLNYNPNYDNTQAILDFHSAVKAFERSFNEAEREFHLAEERLDRAKKEIVDSRIRNDVWGTVEPPEPKVRVNEAQVELAIIKRGRGRKA